jgi:hypothetical protein
MSRQTRVVEGAYPALLVGVCAFYTNIFPCYDLNGKLGSEPHDGRPKLLSYFLMGVSTPRDSPVAPTIPGETPFFVLRTGHSSHLPMGILG